MTTPPPGIDLSSLPDAVRAKVETALARLTPEQRRQFQEHGSPMLAKLVAHVSKSTGAGQHSSSERSGNKGPPPLPSPMVGPARQAPRGHYNQTIQPGDSRNLRVWLVIGAAVMLLAWLWR